MPSSLATECTIQVNVMFVALICRRFLRYRGLHACSAVTCLYIP